MSYAGEGIGTGSFRNLPLIATNQASTRGYFDDFGHPIGEGWDAIPFPDLKDPQAYALEVNGDGMEPCYRDGDILIVAPNAAPRRGDRVLIRTRDGKIMAMSLQRRSARRIELEPLDGGDQEVVHPVDDVQWLARIVWSSQ
jgi:phage repressor protein C with HTH and peptisase S24 domain